MTIPVLVNGAFGRMGQMTAKAISEDPELELVGQTGREYDLERAIKDSQAKVVVDFTKPDSVFENTMTIIEANVHPVIGTTGLSLAQVRDLQTACEKLKLGAIIAPNFSLGAVLMMKCAQEIARYMPNVEIIEMHHDGKADAPSGTALRTAELMAQANQPLNRQQKESRETVKGTRGGAHFGIPIHAVRLPGFLAHQQIIFGAPGETLSLRHDTIDRQCFMPGIILAIKRVLGLDHLVYGLEEILT